jgi:hypothetical protein
MGGPGRAGSSSSLSISRARIINQLTVDWSERWKRTRRRRRRSFSLKKRRTFKKREREKN